MIIGGKRIDFYQRGNLPEKYYEIVTQQVKGEIRKLGNVENIKVKRSIKTNSIYFEIQMYNLTKKIVLSVRTHPPLSTQDNYIYIYISNYFTLSDMLSDMSKKLIVKYNDYAMTDGIRLLPMKINHHKKNRKTKKGKTKNKYKKYAGDSVWSNLSRYFVYKVMKKITIEINGLPIELVTNDNGAIYLENGKKGKFGKILSYFFSNGIIGINQEKKLFYITKIDAIEDVSDESVKDGITDEQRKLVDNALSRPLKNILNMIEQHTLLFQWVSLN